MLFDFQDPNYWLDRADRARSRADVMDDAANKAMLLRIAEDYEILALCAHRLGINSEGSQPLLPQP